jgi:hypothetical protein
MPQSPLAAALLALLTVVLLWTQRNIRRGNEVLRWVQGGLPRLGRRTTLQWLGSSAVRLTLVSPHSPFADAELVIVLEPRDLAWLWAWSRRRGRRDFLILRARLERPPGFELEAGHPAGWTGQDRLKRLDPSAWSHTTWDGGAVRVAYSREARPGALRPLWERLGSAGGTAWRLSVRRDHPHLEVHVPVPDLATESAAGLIDAFIELGRTVMTP